MALFEASGLHKRFGDRVVLEEIDLAFEAGTLTGIMGPNGAGKTTCFNCLTGMYAPDRGEIRLDGADITGLAPPAITRLGVARSFQAINLFDDDTALDNLVVALPRDARALVRRLARPRARHATRRTRAAAMLERVGLRGRERVRARDLAYGERRALEIGARARDGAAHPVSRRADVRPRRETAPRASPSSSRELKRTLTHRRSSSTTCASCSASPTASRHPLGPGDRRAARRTSCATIRGCSARRWGARDMLSVRAIDDVLRRDAGAVRRVARRARGRGRRAARAERRRQDDDAALDPRPDAGARAARSSSTAATSRGCRRTRSRGAGVGWVPDDRRVFPTLTAARNLAIARKRTPFRALHDRRVLRDLSGAAASAAARVREHVRRRAADGLDLARAGRRAGPRAVRRADARAWRPRSCRT